MYEKLYLCGANLRQLFIKESVVADHLSGPVICFCVIYSQPEDRIGSLDGLKY